MKRTPKSEIVKAVTNLEKENRQLRHVLQILVNENIANQGTEYQFVSCRTPEGNVRSWDDAIVLLGGKLHAKRKRVKGY